MANINLGQVATNAVVSGAVTVTATGSVTDLSCSLSGADLTADPTKVCPAALTAGAKCMVGFTFKATTSGPKSDSVVCNAVGLTKTAVVSATVLDPAKLVIAPPSASFQTPNGTQSAAVTFGVANSGGLPTGQISATITGTNANQFAISVPGCLAPLAGASGCNIQVVCNPTSVGTKTATLTVADASAAAASVTAALTCVSVGPTTLTVTGTANLGSVVIGRTGAPQTFTVTNTGTTVSGMLTVSVGDTAQFVKSADTCTGTSLAAAGTCTVAVALKPTSAGALGTILSVTAASGTPGSIQLSGTGLPPGALTVAPPSNDFGSIPVNTVSANVNFTVTNGGGAATGALTVSAPGNGFVVSGNGCAAALQPTQTCLITVHFAPTIVGNATGTVTVTDGTVSGSATLHGTVTLAAALTITPATATFPATVIGQTNGSNPNTTPPPAGITFTVSNGTTTTPSTTDTGALTFTTSGIAAADFVVANNNCPATLPPGSSCTVVVNFTPTAAGTRTALLQVSTVKGGNAAVSLRGTGTSSATTSCTPVPMSTGGISCPGGVCTVGSYSGLDFSFTDLTGQSSVCVLAGSLCGAGVVGAQNPPSYTVWGAGFGFNLSPATTLTTDVPVQLTGTSVTVKVSSLPTGADMRLQVSVNGAAYCAVMTTATQTIPWTTFNTKCWAPTTGTALTGPPNTPNIQFQASSRATAGSFDFCVTALSFQ